MLRIWGRLSSVNVQKVVWCCDELGLPYERIDAGGAFGVNDTPQYLEMNPNGSLRDIAGITNERGNVVGLMPHPEHAVEDLTGAGTDGLAFFTGLAALGAVAPAAVAQA